MQYYKDEPAIDTNDNIIDFPDDDNNCNSFKFKQQITGKTGNGGTKNVEIMVPLKYLSKFWRKLEIALINWDITLQLTCFQKCILAAGTVANQVPKFTKLYAPVANLSTQENIKKSCKNNKFRISAPTWIEVFELSNGSYSLSDIQGYFEYMLKKI